MAKDIVTKAEILGGEIDVRANFGQTVKVTVSPDPYTGDTEVTPSAETQVLATKKKFVQDDITVYPAPTESLATNENGTFVPSSGNVGFSEVVVDVPIGEWERGILIYEGDIEEETSQFALTELPNGLPFSFDRVVVIWSHVNQGQNVDKRTYWRSDKPMTGYAEPLISDRGTAYRQNITYGAVTDLVIEDSTYISVQSNTFDENNPTVTTGAFVRKAHGGYDKITAYAWWNWKCPAGTHIKITGYNRTS